MITKYASLLFAIRKRGSLALTIAPGLSILLLHPVIDDNEMREDRYAFAFLAALFIAVAPATAQEKEPSSITTRSQTPVVIRRLIEPAAFDGLRSEEHTSELQSRLHLVCRLLL